MSLLLAFLLAGQTAEAPCPADASRDDDPLQHQKHGKGLWIGGIAFAPADLAKVATKPDKYSGAPAIMITFADSGRAKFAAAQTCRVGHPIEIWIDNDLLSRPYLNEQVSGSQIGIRGSWTAASVDAIVQRIRATKP